jgi:large subunit ribosomal protein L13
MQNLTLPTKTAEIKRSWHHVDVADKNLGRIATEIAELLMGKSKALFARNIDCGDYVVVTGAKTVQVTGKKEEKKIYMNYSGYNSGLRKEKLKDLRIRKPEEIIRHAVSGMLPKNRLHDRMLKRLYVYGGSEHPYAEKLTGKKEEVVAVEAPSQSSEEAK